MTTPVPMIAPVGSAHRSDVSGPRHIASDASAALSFAMNRSSSPSVSSAPLGPTSL